MADKIKVLFLCVHNSARSQMAEMFLKEYGGERFEVVSAGLEPGILNPLAIHVMKEKGIDISGNHTKSVFDFYNAGHSFDYVITVCDAHSSQSCPVFPGVHKKIAWDFPDPSSLNGTEEDKLNETAKIRDLIENAVLDFIKSV